MQERVDKRRIVGEAIVAGKLPSIEGDPQKLERVVANSVSDAIRPDQGGGKTFAVAGAGFRRRPMGAATDREGKQVPARAKQIGVLISLALLLASMLGPGTTSVVMAESPAVIQHLLERGAKTR